MGLKMKKARLGSAIITIQEYNQSNRGKLICEFCLAKVAFVSRHPHGNSVVQPFFRLYPRAKHSPECNYNVDKQLQNIFAREADPAGCGYIIRILGPNDTLKEDSDKFSSEERHYASRRPNYIVIGDKQEYVSTLHRLIELRSSLESSEELQQKVHLEMKDISGNKRAIKWKDLCYENHDLPRLYERVKRDKGLTHPIFVIGSATLSDSQKGKTKLKIESKEGDNKYYTLEFYINESLSRILAKDKPVRICVYFELLKYRDPIWWKEKRYYHNLYGEVLYDQYLKVLE